MFISQRFGSGGVAYWLHGDKFVKKTLWINKNDVVLVGGGRRRRFMYGDIYSSRRVADTVERGLRGNERVVVKFDRITTAIAVSIYLEDAKMHSRVSM